MPETQQSSAVTTVWSPRPGDGGASELLDQLKAKERRGSKARCHLLTHGSPEVVAGRLTQLLAPWGHVGPRDAWMPQGFQDREEAKLPSAQRLLPESIRVALRSWWLAVATDGTRTPNWDVASTCTIDGKRGLLLVEAKAHDAELNHEQIGRKNIKAPVSAAARRNHLRIGWCIQDASIALGDATRLPWALSRDWNYQMSNRFAWAWKLADLGVPVVLVYLGFLQATEMQDRGKPFATSAEWQNLVRAHSAPLFPAEIWEQRWACSGQVLIPLIRSIDQPLASRPAVLGS